jgi:hypothetical protein
VTPDGTSVIVSAQGPSNSLAFWWATGVTGPWNPELVTGAGTTYSAPAMVVNGNSVNIAAEGPGNSLDFYWAVNGNSTWNPEVVAAAGSVDSAPAMVAQGGGVNIVALTGAGYGSTFYWAFNGTSTWNADAMPAGDVSQSSIVAYPGRPGGVHIVARDLFGYLGETSNVDGSGTFQFTTLAGPKSPFAQPEPAGTAPSATMNGGLLNIAVEGSDGNLNFFWVDSSGGVHQELVDTAANL